MWRNGKRRGILLAWAGFSIALSLLMGCAALLLMGTAARYVDEAGREMDMTLIAQEAVETMKSNRRFQGIQSVPEMQELNGRRYTVSAAAEVRNVEGILMDMAVCTVRPESGEPLILRTLLGKHRETDGGDA